MKLAHHMMLTLASLVLAGGVIAWLCVLPDGTRHTYRRETHVFVGLGTCLIGGFAIYATIVLPVILHALGSRWPFRVFLFLSILFGLLNIGPIFAGLNRAAEPPRGGAQVSDALEGLLLVLGLLILYLLVGICFVLWAVWKRRPELNSERINPIPTT